MQCHCEFYLVRVCQECSFKLKCCHGFVVTQTLKLLRLAKDWTSSCYGNDCESVFILRWVFRAYPCGVKFIMYVASTQPVRMGLIEVNLHNRSSWDKGTHIYWNSVGVTWPIWPPYPCMVKTFENLLRNQMGLMTDIKWKIQIPVKIAVNILKFEYWGFSKEQCDHKMLAEWHTV